MTAPVLQRYDADAGAVNVTLSPEQKVVGPDAVINGVAGVALTATRVGADVALQPLPLVVVTL